VAAGERWPASRVPYFDDLGDVPARLGGAAFWHAGCVRDTILQMAEAARILQEALTLAPEQRARIAHELIDSLSDTGAEQGEKVEAIRAALLEGEKSGVAEDSSLEGVLRDFRASRAR